MKRQTETKIAMINVNGLKDETIMERLKQLMFDERLEVMFITEAHLTIEKQRMLKKTFCEYDVLIRSRKGKKNKQYQQRGGVVCISQKGSVKIESECLCDDMMWIKWRGFFVVCAYFVPATSPFARRNDKRMKELQQKILEIKCSKVLILTDSNAWIGEMPSLISKKEDGYERETIVFERTSEKKETNKQGEWFLSSMNDIDLLVLNGIKSTAQYTYDHPGKEARSIIDFVVVSEEVFEVVSDILYVDCREGLCTDHIMIGVTVRTEETPTLKKRKQKVKREKKQKPVMEFLKTVTRSDTIFWKALEAECDRELCEFVPLLTNTPDEDYVSLKTKLVTAVQNTLAHTKPSRTVLSARLKSNEQIAELRIRRNRLYRKIKKQTDKDRRMELKCEVQKLNQKLKQKVRKAINGFKREQVREIENLEVDDCRRMWKELKTLSGWTSKEKISNSLFDEKKEEVCGERVLEVWKESFKALGIEDEKDDRFDVDFGRQVTENLETIYENSFDPSNFCDELDVECSAGEVVEAIQKLKSAKTAGSDEIVAEILKKGGKQVEAAVYLLCAKVWREEKLPQDWTRGIIFPIYKDGDKRDTGNYRGITLLSIVGKVYAQVINGRLMTWCEKNKVLVEEQGGFRPNRGCPDQLFTLVELLRNRGKKGTYCCFIDVKKAFDRVFRAGLWQRIADEGIKGKMWRVLKSIYETVESCVLGGTIN